jgi:Dolichyl-phosphate-mannose-protein mannosyltransferase
VPANRCVLNVMSSSAPVESPPRLLRRRLSGRRSPTPGEPFPLKRRARAKLPFQRDLGGATATTAVVVLTAVGAAVRLAVTRGLSVDEVRDVDQARVSFGHLITRLHHQGTQPPLHPVLMWLMIHLFGDGNAAVRLPSIVAGITLIPAVAWLASELYDRRTAAVAAMFTAVAPVLVWYSQEASGYILVALFGTLAVIGAARAIRRGQPGDWALHTLSASLAVWSGWPGVFVVIATEIVLVAAFLRRRRSGAPSGRFLAAWGLDTLALVCQLVPLAVLFAGQLTSNGGLSGVLGVAASGVSFYSVVSNVSWALFGFHPGVVTSVLSALWPLAMLASLLMVGRAVGRNGWLLIACAVVPALGVFALGLAAPQAFDVRYFVAAVPPVLVLTARVATSWPRSDLGRWLVIAGVLVVLGGALIDQQVDANNPRRYDYQSAFAQVQRDAGPGSAVFVAPADLRVVLGRDAPRLHAASLGTRLPTRSQARNVFVVTSFANQPALTQVLNRQIGALRATRHLVHFRRYPGVRVWWFR